MGTTLPVAAILIAALAVGGTANAQINCNEGIEPLDRSAESRMSAMDFIKDVAANEVTSAQAFSNFTYTLDASVQTLQGDTVDGEFRQVAKIDFDASGNRRQTVTDGPINTLTRAQIGDRDIEALRDSFTLTPGLMGERDIVYSGRQRIGTFNAAVFDVLPRDGQPAPRRFQGRTWVRASENAIIRVCGRVITGPFGPMRYLVERTRIAEHLWFPEAIRADEDTAIGDQKVHVRVTVKYTDYKAR